MDTTASCSRPGVWQILLVGQPAECKIRYLVDAVSTSLAMKALSRCGMICIDHPWTPASHKALFMHHQTVLEKSFHDYCLST